MKQYFVYIVTNKYNTTFYIGVTNNLERRIYEHKHGLIKGFSKRYNLDKLVYFEKCSDIYSAISYEKRIKNWHRDWKINLIKKHNPTMRDLTGDAETSSA